MTHSTTMTMTARAMGAAALITMAGLAVGTDQHANINPVLLQAGSGSAALNTTYDQPVVTDMSVGVTVHATTPPSTLSVAIATPAGH